MTKSNQGCSFQSSSYIFKQRLKTITPNQMPSNEFCFIIKRHSLEFMNVTSDVIDFEYFNMIWNELKIESN